MVQRLVNWTAHHQQLRQMVDEDRAHPRSHRVRLWRSEVNVEHNHGDTYTARAEKETKGATLIDPKLTWLSGRKFLLWTGPPRERSDESPSLVGRRNSIRRKIKLIICVYWGVHTFSHPRPRKASRRSLFPLLVGARFARLEIAGVNRLTWTYRGS